MTGRIDFSDKLAIDSKGLDALKQSAHNNSPDALKSAATQFEAMFMNMMLKSMREAGGQGGMFDNEQSKMYTSMFDQQMAQKMASRGIGLADAMLRQLSNNAMTQSLQSDSAPVTPLGGMGGVEQYLQQQKLGNRASQMLDTTQSFDGGSVDANVKQFSQKLGIHAEIASQSTGIPAKFMLGQAALESGWGKREIKAMDGSTSHNVFGIKANSQWKGRTVDAMTTEYVDGVALRKVEKFRAYDNYADAFKDYARLITDNPRYQNVMQNGGSVEKFASELQKAGYATDPHYAQKLTKIIKQSLSG